MKLGGERRVVPAEDVSTEIIAGRQYLTIRAIYPYFRGPGDVAIADSQIVTSPRPKNCTSRFLR